MFFKHYPGKHPRSCDFDATLIFGVKHCNAFNQHVARADSSRLVKRVGSLLTDCGLHTEAHAHMHEPIHVHTNHTSRTRKPHTHSHNTHEPYNMYHTASARMFQTPHHTHAHVNMNTHVYTHSHLVQFVVSSTIQRQCLGQHVARVKSLRLLQRGSYNSHARANTYTHVHAHNNSLSTAEPMVGGGWVGDRCIPCGGNWIEILMCRGRQVKSGHGLFRPNTWTWK